MRSSRCGPRRQRAELLEQLEAVMDDALAAHEPVRELEDRDEPDLDRAAGRRDLLLAETQRPAVRPAHHAFDEQALAVERGVPSEVGTHVGERAPERALALLRCLARRRAFAA